MDYPWTVPRGSARPVDWMALGPSATVPGGAAVDTLRTAEPGDVSYPGLTVLRQV